MKTKFFLLFLFLSCINLFAQDTLLYKLNILPATDTTVVFTPADYNNSNEYPVVFMLHGWSGNYAQWNKTAGVQQYADKYGFIIVCPDGFYDSWYFNSPIKENSQFETFFIQDLIPDIEKKYSVDKSNLFITGLSMGGHGAVYMFLKHPDLFRSAGSTSGIVDITKFPDKWGLNKVLGNYEKNKSVWEKHSDIYLLKNIKGLNKKLIVDCGTEDFSFNVNKAFADSCKANNIDIKFISGPGTHSHAYWKSSIPGHFKFFNKIVKSEKR